MDSNENRPQVSLNEMEGIDGMRPQMREDRFSISNEIMLRVHRYKILLRKRWWVMLLGILLGLGPAFVLISTMPPKFQSESKMVMAQRMATTDKLVTDEIQNFMGTQSEMLKSQRVQEDAMDRFLEIHPEVAETWTNVIALNPNAKMFSFSSKDSLRNQALTLTAVGKDAKQVQDYLNCVMDAYLAYKKELRERTSETTFESLTNQISTLDTEIQALRDGISNFRATNNVVMLEQVGSGRAKELGEINTELNRTKRELDALNEMTPEQIQAVVMRQGGNAFANGMAVDTGIGADMSAALAKPQAEYYRSLQELTKLQANREELTEFLRDSHPKVRDLDQQISALQNVVDSFKQMAMDTIVSQRSALEIKVKQLQAAFDDMQAQASAADKMLVEYTNMQEDLKRKQDMFQKLTEMLRKVDLSKVMSNESLSIMDKASPAKNVAHRSMKLLLGFLAGIFIGFVALYIIDLFDDTFGTISELREQFTETVLGQIPEVSKFQEDDELHLLSEENEDSHALIESFRNLRSSIIFSYDQGKVPKVMCVTSSVPSEGKSTVSTNLAVSLAMAGSKVLLIDADIRRGHICKKFKIESVPGLVEFLHQKVSSDQVVKHTDVENLDLIPAGKLQKSPGELFLHPSLDVLLNEMRAKYDFIIMDSAPLLATDDTSNLARRVDGVLFVVRGAFTSIRFARESLKRLRTRKIPLMGLVFNRGYSTRNDSYYYYYDYYEYYGGADGKEKRRRKQRKKKKSNGYYYGYHSHGSDSEAQENEEVSETADEKKE